MPRTILTAALALLPLFPAALLRADDAPKGDKDLDGEWEVQSWVDEGKEMNRKIVFTYMGESMTASFDGKTFKATVKIDASKTPKTMDVALEAAPDRAPGLEIYEVKDDQLRICESMLGKERPKEFSAKEGSGQALVTLKRVKK